MRRAKLIGAVALGLSMSAGAAIPALAAHPPRGTQMSGSASYVGSGGTGTVNATGNISDTAGGVTVSGSENYSATTDNCYSKHLGTVAGGTVNGSVALTGAVGGPNGVSGFDSWSATSGTFSADGCSHGTRPAPGSTTTVTLVGGSATAYAADGTTVVASTSW